MPSSLTASVTANDPAALAAFHRAVDECADGLKGYAARMLRDENMGEDVAQDAFLALFRHLQTVPVAAFRPWLYKVAHNLCLDRLRRRKFKLHLFRDLDPDDDGPRRVSDPVDLSADRPDEIAQTREARAAIDEAVTRLPQKLREAFVLCELEGLPYEEAAEVMGCPVKTVSTRLFRARQRFRSLVERQIRV